MDKLIWGVLALLVVANFWLLAVVETGIARWLLVIQDLVLIAACFAIAHGRAVASVWALMACFVLPCR